MMLFLLVLISYILISNAFIHDIHSKSSMHNFHNKRNIYHKVQLEMSNTFDVALDYIKKTTLNEFVSKDDSSLIIREILTNEEFINNSESILKDNIDSIDEQLRQEERSIKEIIGEESTERILKSIREIDVYDPSAVNVFLSSPAVSSLLSKILFDGIFEFIQIIDVFGNIVNSLPVIGPVRQQIVKEFKKSLDKTLVPQVNKFLKSYNKVAIETAANFVLSQENKMAFGSANALLISTFFERKINTVLPEKDISIKLISDSANFVRNLKVDDTDKPLDFIYDRLNDKKVSDFIDIDDVLKTSPTLKKVLEKAYNNMTNQ